VFANCIIPVRLEEVWNFWLGSEFEVEPFRPRPEADERRVQPGTALIIRCKCEKGNKISCSYKSSNLPKRTLER
jgi:hypothetical protein